ncbi:hypothetical protein [Porphyrobacter sp. GA68]|uniref:hypothetical protein n=1 Tax=Porphyrobacter sp. GA68 TaxID=2883480 RepID=UPI001D188E1F|nr:hypothetical protein [Porphyrobacter sp. GA68]
MNWEKEIDEWANVIKNTMAFAVRLGEILALAVFFQAAAFVSNSFVVEWLSAVLYLAALVHLVVKPAAFIGKVIGAKFESRPLGRIAACLFLFPVGFLGALAADDLRRGVDDVVKLELIK